MSQLQGNRENILRTFTSIGCQQLFSLADNLHEFRLVLIFFCVCLCCFVFCVCFSFSVVKSYCGHGIGSLFHSAPNIPHYARNKAVGVLKPGMIFTIEPMINIGTWKDLTWEFDDWTSVTADGKRSAQFEHTLLVTEKGCEVLTARTKESPKLWWEK